MKKRWAAALIIGLAITLAACGGAKEEGTGNVSDQGNSGGKETYTAASLAKEILEVTEFKDEMSQVDTDIFLGLLNLEQSQVVEGIAYESSGATAEEVVVIKPADAEALEAVKVAYNNRVEDQRSGFENYVPEELKKLETPLIQQVGDFLVLVVADDTGSAEKLLKESEK